MNVTIITLISFIIRKHPFGDAGSLNNVQGKGLSDLMEWGIKIFDRGLQPTRTEANEG